MSISASGAEDFLNCVTARAAATGARSGEIAGGG